VSAFDDYDPLFSKPFWKTPRRDATALGFGLAFIVFGALGLIRSAGVRVEVAGLYSVILVGLGVAGLMSALWRKRS
jgi:hypothetical protein